MKLHFLFVSVLFSRTSGQTCPETHCVNEAVNTEPAVQSCPPSVEAISLATFEHGNDVLIELLGPANMTVAADLVITAPHGGSLRPNYIDDRSTTGPYCPSGCKTSKDSNTKEIAILLQEKFIENYCKVPFLVINHLHRSKLDANREIGEAAQGNATAEAAWFSFHNLTNYAQLQLRDHFGTTVVNDGDDNITGVNALLFDVHGYAGYDWDSTSGGSFIQWGYRLSDNPSLNPQEYCPLDTRSSGTIGSYTHARWMEGHSYECLVRGQGSLASRVNSILDANGGITSDALCGQGMPSYEYPSPWDVANNSTYCQDVASDPDDECHYYSGGFDVEVHERMNWENITGDNFNTVQAELPRCIRFGGSSVREEIAGVLSVALMSFLRDLYGPL